MIDIPAGTEALIFDCDGTLVDTLPLYLKAWQAALQEVAGIDADADWFRGRGGYSEQMLLSAVEKSFGVTVDRKAVIAGTRRRVRETLTDVRCNVPVITIVREWAGRLPLAVASSGSREVVEASLAAIGLSDVFSAVVTIEDVEHPKPAPDIYLLAASKLDVSASRCVVFEDSDEGLKAARAAGMTTMDVRPCSSFHVSA